MVTALTALVIAQENHMPATNVSPIKILEYRLKRGQGKEPNFKKHM
jgi:hypothetical protein